MIAVLEAGCSLQQKADILRFIENAGFRVQVSERAQDSFIGVIGPGAHALQGALSEMPGVREVRPDTAPYPLVSLDAQEGPGRVRVGSVTFGEEPIVVIAGPCAVESREQLLEAAHSVRASGAVLLRGGAFKPRSSPYSFQGLGERGLELLAEARSETGLGVVTEVVAPEDLALVARYADMLQIGARNMQNFRLLSAVGELRTPVLLKRGLMATTDELLMAAEYIVSAGNTRVVLCERGIRTYETATRNTLDLAAVPVLKERTHLPVIVDPSHAAGRREWVGALSRGAVAVGADGLIIEVHPDPEAALSDGRQSLTLEGFGRLMGELSGVAGAMGRRLAVQETQPAL